MACNPERPARCEKCSASGTHLFLDVIDKVWKRAQRVGAREVPELDQRNSGPHQRVHPEEGHVQPIESAWDQFQSRRRRPAEEAGPPTGILSNGFPTQFPL